MGNGVGTECGVRRKYRCSWYGEWDWYSVWSTENVQVWLVWGIAMVQSVE